MKCPNCGLINPDSALQCDCGYRFNQDRDSVSNIILSDSNNQFRTLNTFGKFLSIFGWFLVAAGIMGFIFGLVVLKDHNISKTTILILFFTAVISGILTAVNGQLITCFVSIERNTRLIFEALKSKLLE